MKEPIIFYFAIPSRYAYLAATQMDAFSRETGHEIIWTPVDGNELRQRSNSDPFNGAPPSGQYRSPYRENDLADWVDYYGVPYREPPEADGDVWWKGFGWEKMRMIALAALAGQDLGGSIAWHRALYDLMFVRDVWPFDLPEILAEGKTLGLDPDELAAKIQAKDTASRLTQNSEAAIAAGAFGVPSFVCADRVFFGNDRLPLLRHHLAKLAVD
ncbi:MAG: DsbA family protein [Pseudomonadota bacterium]